MIDDHVEPAGATLARELFEVAGIALAGVYIHGSAVLGDFSPGQSDLDLLVVIEDEADDDIVRGLGDVLAQDRELPAIGLEASIVERSAARHPRAPWRFRLHVTTSPDDPKVISGVGHLGDDDLILHYLVTRTHGWCAYGAPVSDIFGAVERRALVDQLERELRWAVSAGVPESYAVLNACRALRFVEEGEVCSKTSGGEWALSRGIEPALVRAALESRTRSLKAPPAADAQAWVIAVADKIADR